MRLKNIILTSLISSGYLLSSCSSGGKCACDLGDNGGDINPLIVAGDFDIDIVASIPVLDGNPTSSIFYVHNNSDKTITNIKYKLVDQVNSNTLAHNTKESKNYKANNKIIDSKGFSLAQASLERCATLAPKTSCAIEFTTPAMELGNQNSSLIEIDIPVKNEIEKHAQILNYGYYATNTLAGVNFSSSINTFSDNDGTSYIMSYLVASKDKTNYNNTNLQISNPGVISIAQGFTQGMQLAAGQLVPVEFELTNLSKNTQQLNVTPSYLSSIETKQTSKQVELNTEIDGEPLFINSAPDDLFNYKIGNIPLLKKGISQKAYISSTINTGWNSLEIVPGNGLTIANNNCIQSNTNKSYCSFSISTNESASGFSTIEYKTKGITRYKQTVFFLDTLESSAFITTNQPPSFISLIQGQQSGEINYVIRNLGNNYASSLSLSPISSGETTLEEIENNCGTILKAKSECRYKVKLQAGSTPESGIAYININAKDLNNPLNSNLSSQSAFINYQVIEDKNQLIFTSPSNSVANLQIIANGVESQTATFVVKNNSDTAQIIRNVSLTGKNIPDALKIDSNNCGSSLPANSSCNIDISYGPEINTTNQSGKANLVISYGVESNSLTGLINYVAASPDDSSLIISNVEANGFSGEGSSTNPYQAKSCNSDTPFIRVSYQNASKAFTMTNLNFDIIDNQISSYLTVDPVNSTCGYGSSTSTLAPLGKCDLVFKPDSNKFLFGTMFSLNFSYPTASWNTKLGFFKQSSFSYNMSSQIYANYIKPALVSSVTPSDSASLIRVLNQTMINFAGCPAQTTKISSLSPFGVEAMPEVMTGNCTLAVDNSISCTNSDNNPTNTIRYTLPTGLPTPTDMFFDFTQPSGSNKIWLNPEILLFTIDAN